MRNKTIKKASQKNMVEMDKVKPEPAWQGEPFEIRPGLKVKMPATCKLSREEWEAKMKDKYLNYTERVKQSLLTGGAARPNLSSKLLKAIKNGD
jgi:hypothetical protein